MLLIAGLGNPGVKYARNRHNVGFMLAEKIAQQYDFKSTRTRFHSETCEGEVGPNKILLMKPQTFMNKSGYAIGEALRFFKLEPSAVYIAHDELDLPPGCIRIKIGGGDGGHNGLRSINSHLVKQYIRIRIGIGHPGQKERVTGHVLGNFSRNDQDWLEPVLDSLTANLRILLDGDVSNYQNRFIRGLTDCAREAAIRAQEILTAAQATN